MNPPAPSAAAAAAQPCPAAEPLLDLATLQRYRSLHRPGRADLVGRLIEIYVGESAILMQQLRQTVAGGDAPAISRIAHGLKSSSANVGARAMASHCRLLEAVGKGEAGDDARACFAQAERLHALTLQALSDALAPGGALAPRPSDPSA